MQVVDLSYSGGCGLLVVLPKLGIPLSKAIASITPAGAVSDIVDGLEKQELRLFLPRLQVDTGAVSVADALRHIGLCSIFRTDADFTGLTSRPETVVDTVIHRATIAVDEEGTVAAAASALGMMVTSSLWLRPRQPVVMRVDRPYLMLIFLRRTRSILFAAAVSVAARASD